jgi:hypothetical protein
MRDRFRYGFHFFYIRWDLNSISESVFQASLYIFLVHLHLLVHMALGSNNKYNKYRIANDDIEVFFCSNNSIHDVCMDNFYVVLKIIKRLDVH